MNKISTAIFRSFLMGGLAFSSSAQAQEIISKPDIEFAKVDEISLKLDLYLPGQIDGLSSTPLPLIVWVHGGAWRAGSRKSMPLEGLVRKGYAVASVDYRLTPVAPFPSNVHDIKAAIRFLRADADAYGLDTKRFIIAGASAGGHLAALVGVTNGHAFLEGEIGANGETSSDVQAIISFYGASNLETILSQSTPHGLSVRVPALQLLLGGQPEEKSDLARMASPVAHVDPKDPPLLLIHGDQDPQMPINQSHELQGAYERLGLTSVFQVIHGAAHGGVEFYDSKRMKWVERFLDQNGF